MNGATVVYILKENILNKMLAYYSYKQTYLLYITINFYEAYSRYRLGYFSWNILVVLKSFKSSTFFEFTL